VVLPELGEVVRARIKASHVARVNSKLLCSKEEEGRREHREVIKKGDWKTEKRVKDEGKRVEERGWRKEGGGKSV
jgi:hypothetical protein